MNDPLQNIKTAEITGGIIYWLKLKQSLLWIPLLVKIIVKFVNPRYMCYI